ncbi:hypothetical protein ScPMuIL_011117 [Solemya velum]
MTNLYSTNTSGLFTDFCGGSPIWDPASLETKSPRFPDCFQQTLLVWIPCGWLWISLPFYITYFVKKLNFKSVKCSVLNLSKTVLCALLVCLVLIGQLTEEHNGYQCTGLKIPTSHFVATGIKSGTFLMAVILIQLQRSRGDVSSGVLFVFWLIQLIADIIPLQSRISNQAGCAESVVFYVYFAVLVAVFLLHCVAEKKPQTEYTKKISVFVNQGLNRCFSIHPIEEGTHKSLVSEDERSV